MNRIKYFILVSMMIIIPLFFFTSCWSNHEINELLLINTFGIDKLNEEFVITVQVVKPGQLTSKSKKMPSSTITYVEKGDTLLGAFKKISSKVPRKVYTSHLKLILIGEDFAREGISEVMDILLREHQLRANFNIAIVKNYSANYLLEKLNAYESVDALRIEDTLLLSENTWSPISNFTLYPFLNSLLKDGIELTLPGVQLIVEETSKVSTDSSLPSILVSTMCVFKGDKLVGWLTEHESIGLSYITNSIKESFLNVTYDNVLFSIDFYKTKTKIKFSSGKDELHFHVDIKCRGSINDVNHSVDWKEPDIYRVLENNCNRKIKVFTTDVLSKAQLYYESDIFGFGEYVHKRDNSYWQKVKNNWSEVFRDLKVHVNVETKIDRSDKIMKTIKGR